MLALLALLFCCCLLRRRRKTTTNSTKVKNIRKEDIRIYADLGGETSESRDPKYLRA